MKRLILTFALLVSALSAGAWNKVSYPTIMTIASKQLTPEVTSTLKKTLGVDFATAAIADKELYLFSLDEDFVPLRNDDKDALVAVEKCVARLRSNKNDSEAILALAKAIADLHCVSNVRIKGNDFSHNNYIVRRWNNREGRAARYTKAKWQWLWNTYFPARHHLFTPEMYAYDIDLFHARYRAKFVEGSLAEWTNDVVKEYRTIYSENLAENHILTQECVNEYEFIHDRLMAKAGYRLAVLLNDILR